MTDAFQTLKRCSKCKSNKTLDQFHKNSSREDERAHYCKACFNGVASKWRGTESYRASQSRRLERDPDYFVRRNMRLRYGLELEEFKEMVEAQGGVCALCFKPPTTRMSRGKKPPRLSIDHNHETGAVRGLLCRRCNAALHYIENKDWLNRALSYLEDN